MKEEDIKIVLVKLYNGELIIGKKKEASGLQMFNICLEDPRAIAVVPSMSGGIKIAIGSVCEPFRVERLKKEITLNSAQIMFELAEDEIDKELVNGYKSEISGIRLASASETASIANPDGFSF